MKTFANQFILIALSVFGLSSPALSAEPEDAASIHAQHHMMMKMMPPMTPPTKSELMQPTKSVMADYQLPQIQLVRADGKKVTFANELNDGRPVVMNFIYTSCTTICPLASHTLSELQTKLGNNRDRVHIISVSIDPEQDTPAVLTKYSSRFGAGKEWDFYTGTLEASIAAQQAFGVYRGDKMEHNPVTFIRSAPGEQWLRIEGFAKSDELLHSLPNMQTSVDAHHAENTY